MHSHTDGMAAYHQQARQMKSLAKSHNGGSRKLEELSQSLPHETIQNKRYVLFISLAESLSSWDVYDVLYLSNNKNINSK